MIVVSVRTKGGCTSVVAEQAAAAWSTAVNHIRTHRQTKCANITSQRARCRTQQEFIQQYRLVTAQQIQFYAGGIAVRMVEGACPEISVGVRRRRRIVKSAVGIKVENSMSL